jgi:hypothetical protein
MATSSPNPDATLAALAASNSVKSTTLATLAAKPIPDGVPRITPADSDICSVLIAADWSPSTLPIREAITALVRSSLEILRHPQGMRNIVVSVCSFADTVQVVSGFRSAAAILDGGPIDLTTTPNQTTCGLAAMQKAVQMLREQPGSAKYLLCFSDGAWKDQELGPDSPAKSEADPGHDPLKPLRDIGRTAAGLDITVFGAFLKGGSETGLHLKAFTDAAEGDYYENISMEDLKKAFISYSHRIAAA